MYDVKKEKLRTTLFVIIAICGIFTACALLGLAIIGVALAPSLGSEKYFADDANYQTVNAQIVEVAFYNDGIRFTANHSNPNFSDSFIIADKNAALAFDRDAKNILKENIMVEIRVAPKLIGANWDYTVIGLKYGDKVILPFEEAKKNIVDELTHSSEVTTRALIFAGVFFGVFATGLGTSIFIAHKKKVFER